MNGLTRVTEILVDGRMILLWSVRSGGRLLECGVYDPRFAPYEEALAAEVKA